VQDNDDVTGTMDPARARPESAIDDESLFARVAAGDSQALRRFYQLYYRRLHRFLLRITRDPQLADEAVNDTLMVVWQQAGTFRHESRISTWVMGIAYRRALKALEAQRRSRAAVEAERQRRDALEASGHADDVEALAARGDWLERALASLSDDHRLVVELAYFVGFSCEEIAGIADCPVGTVKTRLHHARRYLYTELETLQGEPLRPGELP
jgi:RNA polymerase sigma-70 factor (ECF subfamily)